MDEIRRRSLLLAGPVLMAAGPAPRSVYDFTLPRLEGGDLPLAGFRGQALLIANTASFCGYTPQYAGLQRLYDRFKARGFAVIGVPSNDFNQESADGGAIREFCDTQYGIDFPMAGLSHVRGPDADALFAFLAQAGGGEPRWNFHKYLVARDGRHVTGFATQVDPDQPDFLRAIEAALTQRAP
ncbi:MAG TPA: redoxin domain-containing protein [Roseomonas sp.]